MESAQAFLPHFTPSPSHPWDRLGRELDSCPGPSRISAPGSALHLVPSHAASLTAPGAYPEPLASAVLGQGGRLRASRFQVFARTRSLNEAADLLGTTGGALSSQLAELEQACGGPSSSGPRGRDALSS